MMAALCRSAAFADRFTQHLARFPSCADGGDLALLLREAVSLLGCDSAAFTSFTREDETFESYRYVLACPAAWCNLYNAKRWHAIDPFLIYAANNTEPVLLDQIALRSPGQRELMKSAAQAGFASGAAVPMHTATGRSRMGVLYIGSQQPDYFDREALVAGKMYLRALASEMLEWWCRKIRADLLEQTRVKPADCVLLSFVHQGYPTQEIAGILGTTRTALDQRLSRLSARFGVSNKRQAAIVAYEQGLLEDSNWQSL